MKLVNVDGRAYLKVEDGLIDISSASGGRFGPSIHHVLDEWQQFCDWGPTVDPDAERITIQPTEFGPAIPNPSQVFAVGLNYRGHAHESGIPLPAEPLIFAKFPSSIAPPTGSLELPTAAVDWEVELTVVVGLHAHRVPTTDAWSYIAGLTAAQDFSARDVQFSGGQASQFSMAKSFPGFLPVGPVLVTPDEFKDRDSIGVECSVNGETVQSSSTADLVFDIATLVSYVSHIVPLSPGDLILTGTPAGVAFGMDEPRYLRAGDVVTTRIEAIGEMVHSCVDADPKFDGGALLRSMV